MSNRDEDTNSDTAIERIDDYDATLDQYLTNVCLFRSMGDVVRSREVATNARQYTVASMIFNAVFEMDVDLIRTIALRVDGTVPAEGERSSYANLLGDAIEDVLSYEEAAKLQVTPDDKPVIAMAKALVYIGTQPCGNNYAKRKERNLAAQMILERTGGRKVQPTAALIETEYVEPDWMSLTGGENAEPTRSGEKG